jgi:D-threo-aldose 1-dehydrogenase
MSTFRKLLSVEVSCSAGRRLLGNFLTQIGLTTLLFDANASVCAGPLILKFNLLVSADYKPTSASRRRWLFDLVLAVAAAVTLRGVFATEQTKGQTSMRPSTTERYKLPVRFGLGGVPLGNEFAVITEKIAYATLEAAWSAGVRYYDTSPWYGLGLCERRFGSLLHTKDRREFVISSKVGKLLKASRQNNAKKYFPFTPSPNDVSFDYTADGVKRSIEDSLQRLGLDALDIVFVHDLSPDNPYLPSPWEEQFEIARKGAFPALTRMREEGIIKGWGLGVNRPEPIMKLLDVADADVCLLASQYSLIDHENALHHVFPAARAKGVSFVVGSSLNAGFISGSQRYNYGKENYKIPQPIIEKREKLRASALVVGAGNEQQIVADYSSMQIRIPAEFWAELKERKLIEQDAPVPA